MSEKYKPVKGDRVRVTIEGEVSYASSDGPWFDLRDKHDLVASVRHSGDASIEKIEPPVTVFKPGDVVRDLLNKNSIFALGHRQYLAIGSANQIATAYPYDTDDDFTSDGYELVVSV